MALGAVLTALTGAAAAAGQSRVEPTPGATLARFVTAAGRHDALEMWRLLSGPTRLRLGPTLARFRLRPAIKLAGDVGSYARLGFRVVLEERITLAFAVAAIAGRHTAEGRTEFAAYAVALRREAGGWRLELDGPVRIEAVRPQPGERVVRRTQVAAEVAAPRAIAEAGLWFDGRAVATRGGASRDRRNLTMFEEAPQPLRRGSHTVVAFAATGSTATALGWAFRAR